MLKKNIAADILLIFTDRKAVKFINDEDNTITELKGRWCSVCMWVVCGCGAEVLLADNLLAMMTLLESISRNIEHFTLGVTRPVDNIFVSITTFIKADARKRAYRYTIG